MSILVLKKPLFSQIWGHFSVHKSEISKFLARIHMEYFHVAFFVIPRVCLIIKYGSQSTAFFYVFQCSSGCRVLLTCLWMKTTEPKSLHVPPCLSTWSIRRICRNRTPRMAEVAKTCPLEPKAKTTTDADTTIRSRKKEMSLYYISS